MHVEFSRGIYKCFCDFETRLVPKQAGFLWDNTLKLWFTDHHGVAARLFSYLDDNAKKELAKHRLIIEPFAGSLSLPPDESLYDFQENACLFALARNRSYLALDPGLGKTPVAAVIAQTLSDHSQYSRVECIYICPPFLTRNTEIEFQKWAPRLNIQRFQNTIKKNAHVTIIPDSILMREEIQNEIREFTKCCKKRNSLALLFVDESHRFKNDTASRTKALLDEKRGIANGFGRIVYLSGTPMPNRPIELFSIISHSAPQCIHYMSKFEYAVKYCDAFEHQWGWDFNGASNLEELSAQVIGTFMLRCKKQDVLKQLPPKTEELVILNENLPPKLSKLSKEILNTLSPDDLMKGQIKANIGKDVLHLSTYRKELGILKAKKSAEFIKFLLDETDESILVFAIHREVITHLDQELSKWCPLVVTGDTRMELRHEYVKHFQNDKTRRLFIGNIQAAGTGLTLTKATRVVFVEFSWVPADNEQASDRVHRIGQTDNVFVQYLVHEHSVDKAVIETVLRKKKVTEYL